MVVVAPLRPPAPRVRSVAVVALVLLLVLPAAPAARAGGSEAGPLTAWIDDERAASGRPGLTVSQDLVEVATRHARRMAADGQLRHNAAVGDEVGGWSRLTENVGRGPDARGIHDAFMASSSHRANILDPGVSQVGVGTARDDAGTLWVAQVFRQPSGSPPPPPPPPVEPEPAPRPQPAPEPPPAPTAAAPRSAPDAARTPSPRAPFRVDGVAPAPGPGVPVGPADHGAIDTPPSPALHRLRVVAGWVGIAATLMGE